MNTILALKGTVSTHGRPKAAASACAHEHGQGPGFNTQPPEGGCLRVSLLGCRCNRFNTQPPEGGCLRRPQKANRQNRFNTQPPEGGCRKSLQEPAKRGGFNTQPPEGGCTATPPAAFMPLQFQHTAARRRLLSALNWRERYFLVSTHSRPKAAAHNYFPELITSPVSTHSRPKAAAAADSGGAGSGDGFNTQPPEGGCPPARIAPVSIISFNTQPPEGGCWQSGWP